MNGHREPEHFASNKNKCAVTYLSPRVFFEPIRRDLNEAKAHGFRVTSLTI